MGANNKVSTTIEIEKEELEVAMNMRLNEFKYEAASSLDMKLSDFTSNKHFSSFDRPFTYLTKWPLLKSPENIPMYQNSPNIYLSDPLKTTKFFRFKDGGM